MAKKKTSSTSSSARRPRNPRTKAAPAAASSRPEAVAGFTFDQARADRVANFIERFCVMSKGQWAGAPMKLLQWQRQEIIEPIFGWVDGQDRRRYRQAAIFTPKKQGKSTLLSALALYLTVADGEPGAEVISAACDRQQAGIIAREAASMVRASPQLSRVLEVIDSRNTILHKASGSRYTVISADSFRAEGLNASAVLLDEAHSQRDTRLYDSLRYAGAARRSPLMVSISTAGYSRGPSDLWWQLWQQCERVQADPNFDPTFFGRIWKASDDPAKWFDRAEWYRANPSLGHTVSEESFAADALEARKNPSRLSSWARYRINVPTETDSRWFAHEALGACVADPPEPLEGRACLAGLDLASTLDMTSAAFCYLNADGSHDLEMIYWVPADTVADREAKTRIPYTRWIREGWLRSVEGSRLDHDRVAADIIEYAQTHNVRRIGADPWNLGSIASRLQQGGLEVHAVSQSIGSLTGPSKFLEGLVASRKIRWRSPILTWNLGNVQITEDANGNIRPDRARSSEKIDGAIAAIMSLALTMTDEESGPETFDLITI